MNSSTAGGTTANISTVNKEEHCFVWISNLFHLDKALNHLKKFGFYHDADDDVKTSSAISAAGEGSSSVTFIPYSSRSNWCYKYPMAFPNIHVDLEGNVSGYPYWSPEVSSLISGGGGSQQTTIPFGGAATITTTVAIGGGGAASIGGATASLLPPPLPITVGTGNNEKLFPNASLTNESRSQLHSQIYAYFTWLKNELMIQSSPNGGMNMMMDPQTMMMNNPMINGIGNLLTMMESTFGESVTINSAMGGANNSNKKRKATFQTMMAMMSAEDTPPLLECGLIEPLNQLVVESNNAAENDDLANEDEDQSLSSSPKRRKTQKGSGRSSGAGSGGNAPLDFDDMYNRLLAFKAQHGHVNVPQGYKEDKQLGSWVTNIRYKRKCLQKSGQEYEVEEEEEEDNDLLGGGVDTMPDFDTAANMMGIDLGGDMSSNKKDGSNGIKSKKKKKRLSQERIAQLDNVGFAWSHDKQYKSWDERFNDLQEYKRVNGNTRVPRSSGSLGEWVHMQRKMYHKNDKNFMAKRAPKLDSIGFEWRTRTYDLVSWDDNFQNLVKFGTENQHYNVPSPMDVSTEEGAGTTQEQEEAIRFYKWVKRTRAEYKSLMGGKSSRMLTEDRVAKLRQIGFIV